MDIAKWGKIERMRPIDADALKYTQDYVPCGNGQYKAVNIVYESDIDAAPTIEPKQCDVIYCRDCVFYLGHRCQATRGLDDWRNQDDYCSRAERSEE